MHHWIDVLLLGKAVLAAATITGTIAIALLTARPDAASRTDPPPRSAEPPAPGTTPAPCSDRMSRCIVAALQLAQLGNAALTVLDWLHHAFLL
jgi:hypothetical protein